MPPGLYSISRPNRPIDDVAYNGGIVITPHDYFTERVPEILKIAQVGLVGETPAWSFVDIAQHFNKYVAPDDSGIAGAVMIRGTNNMDEMVSNPITALPHSALIGLTGLRFELDHQCFQTPDSDRRHAPRLAPIRRRAAQHVQRLLSCHTPFLAGPWRHRPLRKPHGVGTIRLQDPLQLRRYLSSCRAGVFGANGRWAPFLLLRACPASWSALLRRVRPGRDKGVAEGVSVCVSRSAPFLWLSSSMGEAHIAAGDEGDLYEAAVANGAK